MISYDNMTAAENRQIALCEIALNAKFIEAVNLPAEPAWTDIGAGYNISVAHIVRSERDMIRDDAISKLEERFGPNVTHVYSIFRDQVWLFVQADAWEFFHDWEDGVYDHGPDGKRGRSTHGWHPGWRCRLRKPGYHIKERERKDKLVYIGRFLPAYSSVAKYDLWNRDVLYNELAPLLNKFSGQVTCGPAVWKNGNEDHGKVDVYVSLHSYKRVFPNFIPWWERGKGRERWNQWMFGQKTHPASPTRYGLCICPDRKSLPSASLQSAGDGCNRFRTGGTGPPRCQNCECWSEGEAAVENIRSLLLDNNYMSTEDWLDIIDGIEQDSFVPFWEKYKEVRPGMNRKQQFRPGWCRSDTRHYMICEDCLADYENRETKGWAWNYRNRIEKYCDFCGRLMPNTVTISDEYRSRFVKLWSLEYGKFHIPRCGSSLDDIVEKSDSFTMWNVEGVCIPLLQDPKALEYDPRLQEELSKQLGVPVNNVTYAFATKRDSSHIIERLKQAPKRMQIQTGDGMWIGVPCTISNNRFINWAELNTDSPGIVIFWVKGLRREHYMNDITKGSYIEVTKSGHIYEGSSFKVSEVLTTRNGQKVFKCWLTKSQTKKAPTCLIEPNECKKVPEPDEATTEIAIGTVEVYSEHGLQHRNVVIKIEKKKLKSLKVGCHTISAEALQNVLDKMGLVGYSISSAYVPE